MSEHQPRQADIWIGEVNAKLGQILDELKDSKKWKDDHAGQKGDSVHTKISSDIEQIRGAGKLIKWIGAGSFIAAMGAAWASIVGHK